MKFTMSQIKLAVTLVIAVLFGRAISLPQTQESFEHECHDGKCTCPPSSVCLGSRCKRSHNTELQLVSGFIKSCSDCRCVSGVSYTTSSSDCALLSKSGLTSSSRDWLIFHPERDKEACEAHVSDQRLVPLTTEAVPWFTKAHSFLPPHELDAKTRELFLNSPWSTLCQIPFKFNQTFQASTQFPKHHQDQRSAVWLHNKLAQDPAFADLLFNTFSLDEVDSLTYQFRQILVVYIHELHDGPLFVIQPLHLLNAVCSNIPGGNVRNIHASSTDQVEHVMRALPEVLVHAHFKTVKSFTRIWSGSPVEQVQHSPDIMRLCLDPWPHAWTVMDHTFDTESVKPRPTLSMVIPTYPGHWPYLREAAQLQYESTEQPDQLTISSGNTDLSQALQLLSSMPNKTAESFVVVIGSLNNHCASDNRNMGTSISRMTLTATIDGDDVPHVQRNEFIRLAYQRTGFCVLGHPCKHHDKYKEIEQEKVECLSSTTELMSKVYGNLYNTSWVEEQNQLKALRGPRHEKHAFTHHGSTAFETRYFRVAQWIGAAAGEDQRFNRVILSVDRNFGRNTGYFMAWRLMWYFQARTARTDKSKGPHL